MKVLNLMVCILFSFLNYGQNTSLKKVKTKKVKIVLIRGDVKHVVSGNVTRTESYCGGVELTPTEFDNYNKTQPNVGKVFYVRKGNENTTSQPIVATFTTDASGNFKIELPNGIYSLIVKEQANKLSIKDYPNSKYLHTNEECLRKWWKKPLYVFEIKDKEITDLKFNFHWPCFINSDVPCIGYSGPLPP